MNIYLVRHAEALKNVDRSFSSEDGRELVTRDGELETEHALAALPRTLVRDSVIAHAPDLRSAHLANALGTLVAQDVQREDRLSPWLAGEHAGLTEAVVAVRDPQFYAALRLYRLGLLNGYAIPTRGETLLAFESRVEAAIRALERIQAPAVWICAHSSAITAALMHYVRRLCGADPDFYGYVKLPLLSVSIVTLRGDGSGEIRCVGERLSWLQTGATDLQGVSPG